MKSTHQALVYRLEELKPHPYADKLDLIEVDNYTCAVRKGDFKPGDLFVYIVPDTLVDTTRPEFHFLPNSRIKVKKLRGLVSQGLIIPAPAGFNPGDDTWDYFQFQRYEPEDQIDQGDSVSGPDYSKYDVDSIQKKLKLMYGKEVVYTEKVHGASWRCLYQDELKVGSRSRWVGRDSEFWCVLNKYPQIEELVKSTGLVLYGEMFGKVQNIKYGRTDLDFRAFDLRRPDWTYLDYDEFISLCAAHEIPTVPELGRGAFDWEWIKTRAELSSCLYDGGMEGIVVKTLKEINHPCRMCFKYVSNWYYEK